MSSLIDRAASLHGAAVDAAWRQWRALGGSAATDHPAHSIVDPEALVLFTISAGGEQARLSTVLYSWLEVNASLLSVQRMRNLSGHFPDRVADRLSEFSRHARAISRHPRWTALDESADAGAEASAALKLPTVRRAARVPLRSATALVLRLRAAFGVSTKADVLCALLGARGAKMTVKDVVALTAYTSVAVRSSLEDLAEAGMIDALPGKPQSFRAPRKGWEDLLRTGPMPAWHAWWQFYAFCAALRELAARAKAGKFSEYALSVKVRDLLGTVPELLGSVITEPGSHGREPIELAEQALLMMQTWVAAG